MNSEVDILRFATAGSVDDGKSTLIGRLLYDAQGVFVDQLESLKGTSDVKENSGIDFALITDGLKAEREQGITIDVAYRYFSTPKRKFIIADTPGHIQYTRNMFTGASNSGKFVLTFSDDKTRTPEITPITVSNADKQYLALQELLVQNILTGHRVTSPMLMGIKNDTGLGSNVDELNSAANYYLNTVCKPYQNHIIKTLRKIFQVNNMDMPISFVQLKPITLEFTSEDLKGVMTEDEIREELGLKPLDVEVREDFAKVGSMITDGVELPLFETKEEAEAEAKKMGCSGWVSYHQ